MAGTLYLVGTPIGNLEDMTWRAVRTLMEADLIACEDTRTSAPLLRHFEIKTPVTSYHKFNEREKSEELLGLLLQGRQIALITDAGMPAISDPGEILVGKCREMHVPVTVVPGPSACVTALALSGADTRRFVFEGFLPADNRERREALTRLQKETRTMILYEAPHRLLKTLALLGETFGEDRPLTVCRELTKRFEETVRTTIGEAIASCRERDPRGEYVLVIDGKPVEELLKEEAEAWSSVDLREHVARYEAQGLTRKEAMKAVALERGMSRRDVYQALLSDGSR